MLDNYVISWLFLMCYECKNCYKGETLFESIILNLELQFRNCLTLLVRNITLDYNSNIVINIWPTTQLRISNIKFKVESIISVALLKIKTLFSYLPILLAMFDFEIFCDPFSYFLNEVIWIWQNGFHQTFSNLKVLSLVHALYVLVNSHN